jgi:hypothetical protein
MTRDMSALLRNEGWSDGLRDPGLAPFLANLLSKPKDTPATVCFGEVQDRERRVLVMTSCGIGEELVCLQNNRLFGQRN